MVLVVSDAHAGLKAAIARYFQGAAWQRCQVHFMRDVAVKTSWKARSVVLEEVKSIFAENSRAHAMDRARIVAERLRDAHPRIAEMIDEDIEQCLSVLSFPAAHRRRLRTTNALERVNQEILRRTRVIRTFPSEQSAVRLIASLCIELSEEWAARRYLNMELLDEWIAEEDAALKPQMLKVS